MPRKKASNLTEVEQRLMEVLWSSGSGTVAEVLAALKSPKAPAFNTVQTILRILEQKGYVRHTEEGRAFRYFPKVDRTQATRSALHAVVRRFFDGSAGALAVNLIQTEPLSDAEIAHLRQLLAKAEEEK
ncbi:MAG TPA: BlaI/MecI/CopY family transcriptional regulator [Candidatus Rubrimentiphilum sp.]|nr:BlaI/MecI/CopY family transcriptional regulator [Candidatus Rubrimentiphilum sp.]